MNSLITHLQRFFRPYGPESRPPLVTLGIIVACVLADIAARLSETVSYRMLFAPVLAENEPYRFLTSAFMHSGFWHLLLNMYALWILGSILEPILGRGRFTAIYLLSAVAGNVTVLLFANAAISLWNTAVVGASGAVFGLLGAQMVIARLSGADLTNLLVVIGLNLAIGFAPGMNISWQSHVGGFIMGVVTVKAFSYTHVLKGRQRKYADALVTLVLCGVLAVLAVIGMN